jgi:phosphatidylserine decarboxylase
MKDKLFIASQYLLPHHLLSRLVGRLAACDMPWLKNLLIRSFMRKFDIQLDEAERSSHQQYTSFNDFFTRALKEGARPIDTTAGVIPSPVDGAVSQLGKIEQGQIFQAKGQSYSLTDLLGGDRERARPFMGGEFATLYLSPRDYHRVHMPFTGTLREMVYIPGALFSVNQTTAENVPGLFARNERLVAIFDTESGPVAMVLVGAMIVAAIETVWAGRIAPPPKGVQVTDYQNPQPVTLNLGDEMGRFLLGSTVILCYPPDTIEWDEELASGSPVQMGKSIAKYCERPALPTDNA